MHVGRAGAAVVGAAGLGTVAVGRGGGGGKVLEGPSPACSCLVGLPGPLSLFNAS